MPNDRIHLLFFFPPITQNPRFDAKVYYRSQEVKIRKLNREKINTMGKNKYEAGKPWIENGVAELHIGLLL